MNKGLEALNELKIFVCSDDYSKDAFDNCFQIIEKELKAFEIIKENLVVSYDESENDNPCLVIGFKVDKDTTAIIYHTFDKEKIDLLKEVLQ